MIMEKEAILKLINEQFKKNFNFTSRKITDMPTDRNQATPRGYVTRNSTTANRPTTSVLGEFYFDTTVSRPAWWNGTNYQDGAGNVV